MERQTTMRENMTGQMIPSVDVLVRIGGYLEFAQSNILRTKRGAAKWKSAWRVGGEYRRRSRRELKFSDNHSRQTVEDMRQAAGHELAAMHQAKATAIQRDIVDMFYDDGLTPKEALEIERQRRAKEVREFCRALGELQNRMVLQTCDSCGVDLQSVNDYKMVDRQPMCLACVKHYDLRAGADYDHGR
jgi:hypothetical protein